MITISARIRKEFGKSASRRLRSANKCPAIIYGGKGNPISIELDHDKIWNVQCKVDFYHDIINILIDKKEEMVKVQAIQRHPYKPKLIHVDFIRM